MNRETTRIDNLYRRLDDLLADPGQGAWNTIRTLSPADARELLMYAVRRLDQTGRAPRR